MLGGLMRRAAARTVWCQKTPNRIFVCSQRSFHLLSCARSDASLHAVKGRKSHCYLNPFPLLSHARSDERACAYIAGPAPLRWGTFGSNDLPQAIPSEAIAPPAPLPPGASKEERVAAAAARRSHPLYSSVMLLLLTEIINSRLFTTVRARPVVIAEIVLALAPSPATCCRGPFAAPSKALTSAHFSFLTTGDPGDHSHNVYVLSADVQTYNNPARCRTVRPLLTCTHGCRPQVRCALGWRSDACHTPAHVNTM